MNYRTVAEQIFLAGVDRVLPSRLINKAISFSENCLQAGELSFMPDSFENIYVIGAGKASALMGAEIERMLGDRITGGHIIVKDGHSCHLARIRVSEAGHPVPDSRGLTATRSIVEIAATAGINDFVICLLSGGGSALLFDCPEGISSDEIQEFNKLIVNSGASISEINTVRKHLSELKGGQLARAVYPGTLLSLILSDVINDPLDVIASGPTVPDPSTFQQALGIIRKYALAGSVPRTVISYLTQGAYGKRPETPKKEDPVFDKTFNLLIGNNRLALEAARDKALELNITPSIINDHIGLNSADAAEYIVESALKVRHDNNVARPVCLLFGGEPTIKVTGKGLGGRNQHLALTCASLLRGHDGITILSAGTDGTDGPTSAAGAVVDSATFINALAKGINPPDYLATFDSYNFFRKAGGHIITGPTMTNVMDIIIVLIQ